MMEFLLPEVGEGIHEVELVEWLVRPGDEVVLGQGLAEILTDKATMQLPSPFAGVIGALMAKPGSDVRVGQAILTYRVETQPSREETLPISEATRAAGRRIEQIESEHILRKRTSANIAGRVRAAPSVRRLARKLHVDLLTVVGSGPGGRILIDDVTRMAERMNRSPQATPHYPPHYPTHYPGHRSPQRETGRASNRVKLRGVRRRIAEQTVRAKHEIPHYSFIDECNVSDLVGLRQSLKEALAQSGIKLTYLAFVIKALTKSLAEMPLLNSTFDAQSDEIILHEQIHIGFAVATPNGLLVPVIRNADEKDIQQLAADVQRLTEQARSGNATSEDLQGGTFTVTSIGNIGGLISTPVINHPQVGILGLGKIVRRPVFDDQDRVVPANLMYLSFSFDHRVIDGDVAAKFSNSLIERLERPATMLLRD